MGILALIVVISLAAARRENQALQAKIAARQASLESADRKIEAIVAGHLDALATRRSILLRVDPYGRLLTAAWQKELRYFFDHAVRPALTDDEFEALHHWSLKAGIKRLIEDPVVAFGQTRALPTTLPPKLTPFEFEGLCAETLQRAGWTATTTKGSGDQGADVIASKDGRKLVLQCKLYSGAVGNKAIQEVLGAKHFYAADLGAVVSTSSFTRGAVDLARASGVRLLSYAELEIYASEAA